MLRWSSLFRSSLFLRLSSLLKLSASLMSMLKSCLLLRSALVLRLFSLFRLSSFLRGMVGDYHKDDGSPSWEWWMTALRMVFNRAGDG